MFTRAPTNYRSERRRPLTVILVVLAALYLLLTAAGTLWTDYLWFESVGFQGIWLRNWGLTILLGAIGLLVSFAVIWLSLVLVDRLSPRWAPFDLSEEEELVERFREWVEPRVRQLRVVVSVGLALLLGLAVATWRDQIFLFLNHQEFGSNDPVFGIDLGFYVFRLPMWDTAVDWLFNLLVVATIVVIVSHYLNGGIRFDGRRLSSSRGAKIQISIMFAIVALIRAASYRLDMYEIVFADRAEPRFFGPGYADINARLPALRLLLVIALIAAVLFAVNIFRRGWTIAAVSIASWIVVAVAAGSIYPAIVQRFSVLPNQLTKEMPYITNNLTMTRAAYGLDQVEVRNFSAADDLDAADIERNRLTIDNVRVWSTSVLPRTYQNFQELEPYYALERVDTDRYVNEGVPTQVMVGVRELDEDDLPRADWQNVHLFYTHGFGAVINEANVVQEDGQPSFLLKDVPPVASVPGLELVEPRVYFGETYQRGRPVIVRTGAQPQEVDIPLPEGTQYNEYTGDAGVTLDSIWKRIAFAFRYRDLNLLISSEIRSDSRVLVERNVDGIANGIAPFLISDADPYPVILDGRILWVVDMYTTTRHYPYSQPLTNEARERLTQAPALLPSGVNYIRNSVKAVVDADNGDVTFYTNDPTDPMIRAWASTYPGTFKDKSEMPDGLEDHLRYPQDLFKMQSYLYLEYHVTEETELFNGNDAWSFPQDPQTINRTGEEQLRGDNDPLNPGPLAEVLPYYLLTELPGEQDLSYLLMQPFNPRAKRNMVSFLVADSTPGRYGRLIDFRMPQGRLVDGVEQVGQRIEQDADISQQLTLWEGAGSTPIRGELLVVPVEDGVVYFQPIYLEEFGGAFPEFRRVAVVYGDDVEWADTLDGALELVFGEGSGPSQPEEPTEPGADSTLEELVTQANAAFANADQALRLGDLAEYQRWVDEAQRILGDIQDLIESAREAAVLHVS